MLNCVDRDRRIARYQVGQGMEYHIRFNMPKPTLDPRPAKHSGPCLPTTHICVASDGECSGIDPAVEVDYLHYLYGVYGALGATTWTLLRCCWYLPEPFAEV